MDTKKAKDATLVFQTKMDAGALTDAQIRLQIKALRSVILERQQRRATEKNHVPKGTKP